MIEEDGTETAVEIFLRNAVSMTDEEIELMRGDELWGCRIEAVPTIPREIRAPQRDLFDPSAFDDVSIETTVLVGGDSPEPMQEATQLVADALNANNVVSLDGQEHMAMHEAPIVFVDAIMAPLKKKVEQDKLKPD